MNLRTLSVLASAAVLAGPATALTFNFSGSSAPSSVLNAFAKAGQMWSDIYSDNFTINVNVGWQSMGGGVLGATGSSQTVVSLNSFRNALTADATSLTDASAVASLGAGQLTFLANRDTTFGSGIYDDNNNSNNNNNVRLTTANAKALGFSVSGTDAFITFNSNFNFDFDPSNGITSGQYDLVGIAAHEIGHAMGFISGVDQVDTAGGNVNHNNSDYYLTPMDVFRYSSRSGWGIRRDFVADGVNKYFSVDGGITNMGNFSTGIFLGDGNQASHWKDNQGIGLMDPTAAPSTVLSISANDIRAFDAIGYDLQAVPEPLTMIGLGVGALALLRKRKKA